MVKNEFLGKENSGQIGRYSKEDSGKKEISKIIYESRKDYFREYYLENKTVIKDRANDRARSLNPIQKAVVNQGRRKRRKISKGIK